MVGPLCEEDLADHERVSCGVVLGLPVVRRLAFVSTVAFLGSHGGSRFANLLGKPHGEKANEINRLSFDPSFAVTLVTSCDVARYYSNLKTLLGDLPTCQRRYPHGDCGGFFVGGSSGTDGRFCGNRVNRKTIDDLSLWANPPTLPLWHHHTLCNSGTNTTIRNVKSNFTLCNSGNTTTERKKGLHTLLLVSKLLYFLLNYYLQKPNENYRTALVLMIPPLH